MTIRLGRPEGVDLPPVPTWRDSADTAVHRLARDFADQAWSNSRRINGQLGELAALLERVSALPGGDDLGTDVDDLVLRIASDVSDLAAGIGVEVAQRFAPDDLWREMVTDYGDWPRDWGEPHARRI